MPYGLSSVPHSASTTVATMELSVLVGLETGSCFAGVSGHPRSNHDVYYLLFVVSNLIYDVDLFKLRSDLASYLRNLPTAWTVNSFMESDVKQAITAAGSCSTHESLSIAGGSFARLHSSLFGVLSVTSGSDRSNWHRSSLWCQLKRSEFRF